MQHLQNICRVLLFALCSFGLITPAYPFGQQGHEAIAILALQKLVRQTPVADHIFQYAARLVRSTRPADPDAPPFIRESLSYGAGPRASLFLILAGKARAVLQGRFHVSIEDIQTVAPPVMRHRIIPNFAARSEALTPDRIIQKLLDSIPTDERLYHGNKRPAAKALS